VLAVRALLLSDALPAANIDGPAAPQMKQRKQTGPTPRLRQRVVGIRRLIC
jgi:hypothetical protein